MGVGGDGYFVRRIYSDFVSCASVKKRKYLAIPTVMELARYCPHDICGGRLGLKSFDYSSTEPVVWRRKLRPLYWKGRIRVLVEGGI